MNKSASSGGDSAGKSFGLLALFAVLLVVLAVLFYKSFMAGQVLFSNDGPIGIINAKCNATSLSTHGSVWQDLNWFGGEGIALPPSFTAVLLWVLQPPVLYAKFAAPIGLLVLGLSAWLFFRQLRLAPVACFLGGIATALNSDFFSTACWGIVAQSLCIASNFLALAALARVAETSSLRSWARVVLAGLAVGMGVMQGWDVGALFSLFIAAYMLYQALFMDERNTAIGQKLGSGIARVVLVAAFAVLISTATLTSLIGTQIGGVAGMAQDEQTRQARWEQATTWSLPKSEILQVMVPGLFGYRNHWHMYDYAQPKDDQYWGLIGDNGPDSGLRRLSGTGLYAGVFVVMVVLWAIFQSLRGDRSPFSLNQRRALWFWSGALGVTMLLSFGKYLPFLYRMFYALPYASTIRNPTKFMHVFSWALVIVFAYGMHGLYVAFMEKEAERVGGFWVEFKAWWRSAATFDQVWLVGGVLAIVASAAAWIIYAGKLNDLIKYLPTVDIPEGEASGVANFSVASVGWFIFFLMLAVGFFFLIFTGRFSGAQATFGAVAIAVLLVVDLGRADAPWINYWDMSYKYADDPIITFFADKPYEHRVGALVWADPNDKQYSTLYAMYGTAWKQHLFWYHNIQCVDIVQEPRVGEDKKDFIVGIRADPQYPPGLLREWELTGTRYLLGETGVVPYLNQQFDPQKHRFKIAQLPDGQPATFSLTVKPGAAPFGSGAIDLASRTADFTTRLDTNGQLAVIEFTGALPRAALIPNWQVNTNDALTLQTLADPNFDPHETVLVANSLPAPPPPGPNPGTGTVSITDYKPKRIQLAADVNAPCVLLMADRFNPKWKVTVDGKPQELLRCNFVERGVFLDAGKHDVVFSFSGDYTMFCVSLGAAVVGLALCGWLAMTKEPEPAEPVGIPQLSDGDSAAPEDSPESRRKKSKIIDVQVLPTTDPPKKKPK